MLTDDCKGNEFFQLYFYFQSNSNKDEIENEQKTLKSNKIEIAAEGAI